MVNVHAHRVVQIFCFIYLLILISGFIESHLEALVVQMSTTDQVSFPPDEVPDERGATWRFEDGFSTNMLDKTLSLSDQIAKLQEMFITRLGHTRPPAVTGCMIVINEYKLQQLLENKQIIICGYVQGKDAMREKYLQKWIPDCEWTRLSRGLYDDDQFRQHISDPQCIKINVYQELKWENNTARQQLRQAANRAKVAKQAANRANLLSMVAFPFS